MSDFAALRSHVSGTVLTPRDQGFAAEVTGVNLSFPHRPDVVVGVASVADAVAAVTFAQERRMPVRMLATGHGSHTLITDGMLITTFRLDSLSIDERTGIASIGAGVRWDAVVAAAAPLGLAPITGSSTNVGVVGYLLGGGLGPLARSHGVSSDWVRGFTTVLASGEVAHASVGENPDLFWALRGGKGGFGLVVGVELQLASIPSLYAGALVFAEENIAAVMRGWVDWTSTAPDVVTTSVAIVHFPKVEGTPDELCGRTLAMLRFAFPGDATRGEQLAAPLRALARAVTDTVAALPLAHVATIHDDPSDPSPSWSRGALLSAVDQNFATEILAAVGAGTRSPIMVTEVRHLGGATVADVAEGSSVGGRTAAYALSMVGAPNAALFESALPRATDALLASIAPWVSPETTINFAAGAPGEEFAKAWPAHTLARLAGIRSALDPDHTFAFGPGDV